MAFLAELAESAARGETRATYEEMKRLGGVPMVALIFRHLATLPGGLEWAWDALGPAWKNGHLQEEAWGIARAAPMEAIAPMPREALAALGVDDAGLREIHVVADAYNLANPVNLLSVRCLSRMLHGARTSAPLPATAWTPPAAPGPLVPMIDVGKMPLAVASLLDLAAAKGAEAGGDTRVVPSLYRHFGHRPQFLALLVTLLLPRFGDGSIRRSAESIRAAMEDAASRIAKGLCAPPAPDPRIAAALERFSPLIPQMIVVGALLKRSLPG
jgi:hypothetical protein